jgi:hypothetical protein
MPSQKGKLLPLSITLLFVLAVAEQLYSANFVNGGPSQVTSENKVKGKDLGIFKWRVIEPWLEPDGPTHFAHAGNILTWADMLNPQPSSALCRYVAQVREWGFNGMSLMCDPEQNPEAVRNFASYLKQNGIGFIIRRDWNETERGRSYPLALSDARPRSSEKLCPYSKATRAYWQQRIEKDFKMIPDAVGYRMWGTEFYFCNGAPWMCDCAQCRTKTGRERTRDAIRLVAELLGKHGATLFWETCQDDPWGQRHETYYFRDMTGEIPENAFIVIKREYWDYHPRYPRHPLFDFITKDARGYSPYITSFQQPGEYRGSHDFPWCMVDEWSGAFQDMVKTGQQGLWVAAIVQPQGWDNPLNMVNWYALAHYMRDPQAEPAQIKLAWANERFGKEAGPAVVEILDKVTGAARGMFEFDALWTANHSRFPTLDYLDSHLCGPYRQGKRMTGIMGMAWPLDMYPPKRVAEIMADPQIRLLFNQVPITPKLKAEAMSQKDGAVKLMEEAIALWKNLEGKIDSETYKKILAGLEGNRNDTIIFRNGMDIYMDWKLGVLTEEKIDSTLQACRGLRGIVVPEPLDEHPKQVTVEPASLATFAEQLRRELREPWVEMFFRKETLGVGVTGPVTGLELIKEPNKQ